MPKAGFLVFGHRFRVEVDAYAQYEIDLAVFGLDGQRPSRRRGHWVEDRVRTKLVNLPDVAGKPEA